MTKMEKEIFEQPRALREAYAINRTQLDELVREIEQRDIDNVYFAARGTSDHASIYGQYMLGTFKGIATGLALPSVFTLYGGTIDLTRSLVMGMSQSGQAADALAVLESAKAQGALTAAVTNVAGSPMDKTAAFSLSCAAGPEISVAATKSFTTEMYVLAMLTAKWAKNAALEQELLTVPDAIEELLDTLPDRLDEVVQRYRYMSDGFVLARGMNYPVALETALKIQETNYIKIKGYAVSDFYHGPMAQVSRDTPVIVYAAKGPAFQSAVDMISKLSDVGAEIIVVTDDADYVRQHSLGFLVPDLGKDYLTTYLFAVFAQLFACKLAGVRGLDPDAPRMLKKVTITR